MWWPFEKEKYPHLVYLEWSHDSVGRSEAHRDYLNTLSKQDRMVSDSVEQGVEYRFCHLTDAIEFKLRLG